ncbi:MAG: hypothetical protein AB1449_05860 [Chloroflexota bacterium]
MDSNSGFYILEYSPSQRAWHISTIEDVINKNLLAYLEDRSLADYMLMGFARSHDELLALQAEITSAWTKLRPPDVEQEVPQPQRKATLLRRIASFFGSRRRPGGSG